MEDNVSKGKLQAIADLAKAEVEQRVKKDPFFDHFDMTPDECLDLSANLFDEMFSALLKADVRDTLTAGRLIVEMCVMLNTTHRIFNAVHLRLAKSEEEIRAEVENAKGF